MFFERFSENTKKGKGDGATFPFPLALEPMGRRSIPRDTPKYVSDRRCYEPKDTCSYCQAGVGRS